MATGVGGDLVQPGAGAVEEPNDDPGDPGLAGVLQAIAVGVEPHEVADRGARCAWARRAGSDVSGSEDAVGSEVATMSVAAANSWDRSVPDRRYCLPARSITVAPPTMRTWLITHSASAGVAEVTRSPLATSWVGPAGASWISMSSPGPPSRTSVPPPPMQHVVAGAAEEGVVAGAADEDVVAVAAVGGELDRAGLQARGLDHVVAGQRVDGQPVVGGLGAGDVHPCRQAEDRRAAGVAGHERRRRRRWWR